MAFDPQYQKTHEVRFDRTLKFLQAFASGPLRVLDIGPDNPMSELMRAHGYHVTNTTPGIDLDFDLRDLESDEYEIVTAFQVLEHMVNPFGLLRAIRCDKLVASVPLNLWFNKAYWNEKDPFDRHYHEFEDRQFDMLLDKCGWEIVKREKWNGVTSKFGIRPFLRRMTPRHYIVACIRK